MEQHWIKHSIHQSSTLGTHTHTHTYTHILNDYSMPQAIWCYLYIVFEYNFQSIDGLSMNLAILMSQGTTKPVPARPTSLPVSHLWIMYGKVIASFPAQERWKPPNRGEQ